MKNHVTYNHLRPLMLTLYALGKGEGTLEAVFDNLDRLTEAHPALTEESLVETKKDGRSRIRKP